LKVVDLARIVLNRTVEPITGFPCLANPGASWPPVGERIAQASPIVGLWAWTLPIDLIRHLGRFWGSVRYAGLVPRSDLILPVDAGSTQRLDFGRKRIAVDIPPNTVDVLDREIGVGVGADLTKGSVRMPRHLDLTTWVAGSEEAEEFRSSVIGEPLSALVSNRRSRRNGSSLLPRCPICPSWTRRRISPAFVYASFTNWNVRLAEPLPRSRDHLVRLTSEEPLIPQAPIGCGRSL
jgi:hypothetical protein